MIERFDKSHHEVERPLPMKQSDHFNKKMKFEMK